MDINTMMSKRTKLLEKIKQLNARIEKDTASLKKAKNDLDCLNDDLLQSADLMANILGLDPNEVRGKLMQQASMEPADAAAFPAAQAQEKRSKKRAKASDPESKIDAAAGAEIPPADVEVVSEEKTEVEIPEDNVYGLKINPFDSIL